MAINALSVSAEQTEVVKQDDNLSFPNPNALTITSGDATVTYDGSAAASIDIPTALKNPNALTVKIGSTTVTYDGSSAQTVEIADGTKVEY